MTQLQFTEADADVAHEQWGANCGPGAIAAVLGMSLTELRPFLGDFERKGYLNPTLMWEVLARLKIAWQTGTRPTVWPRYGLARIQWEGPWTAPGAPARWGYRHTHWVGADAHNPQNIGIFDINCMNAGGWVSLANWTTLLVPWLLENAVPRANGKWHLTHAVEIERPA